MEQKIYDLLIIGAGPAGLSASIYASRAGLVTGMIDKDAPGGKMVKTNEIENYLGYEKIMGADLSFTMYNHAIKFGTEHLFGNAINIKDNGNTKEVVCEDQSYFARTIIIATGTVERKMNIPGEEEFYGRGISYCAVCDGALYSDKPMMVIGGGNSALQEALYLTRFSDTVYLSHRRNEFRGEDHLAKQVRNNPKIKLLLKRIPLEVKGDMAVNQIVLKNLETNNEEVYDVDVVFPFIGLDAATDFLKNTGILNKEGYIVVDENLMTKMPGVFAAGDVLPKSFRQIVTASSDGAIAANSAVKYIDDLK